MLRSTVRQNREDRTAELARLEAPDSDSLETVVAWLQEPLVAKWLDFGSIEGSPTRAQLRMLIRARHQYVQVAFLRTTDEPLGFFCLSQSASHHRSAMFWGMRARLRCGAAVRGEVLAQMFITKAFEDLDLNALHTWAVSCNALSVRMIERIGFRRIGVQRQCHVVDGEFHDRIHFDLLRSDWLGIDRATGETGR